MDYNSKKEFVLEEIRKSRIESVNMLNGKFLKDFYTKFPTNARNKDNYVRNFLNKLVEDGVLKKQRYNLGGGSRDLLLNRLPTSCMVYQIKKNNEI